MFTAEERQQIKQLEDMGCKTVFETNIKEVEGGHIIQHRTSYVLEDEVKGMTQEQYVAATTYHVTRIINMLYEDEKATMEVPARENITYTREGMRDAQDQAYVQSQTNPHINPKGSMNG